MVETMGLEPTTPCLQSRCSSQLSYVPEMGCPKDTGGGSVVLEGHGVRGDVHLRLVLGDLDDPALGSERLAQLGAAAFAGAVEPGVDGRAAARAAELHAARLYRRR